EWLRRVLPGSGLVRLEHETPLDRAADAGSDQLVIVLRDAHRHSWQQEAVEALVATSADAVVVETGLPYWRPSDASAHIATFGAGRVNLEAAAERLRDGAILPDATRGGAVR